MVALKSSLPVIRLSKGVAVSFEVNWLRSVLERAAAMTGCHPWLFTDDLIAGITSYFRYSYHRTVVDLPTLENAICRALRDTGYGDFVPHLGRSLN